MRLLIVSCLFLLCLGNLAEAQSIPVRTGLKVLADEGFSPLAGKRVGLITNRAAVADGALSVELFARTSKVHLQALFAPEHGLLSHLEDGIPVEKAFFAGTDVPIYSLYGDHKKPSQEMLKNLDCLVFDMQDVGSRFYTYISTMGLAMQSAAQAGIPFVVLDRPNPVGGDYVAGFVLRKEYESFTGLYSIPSAYGMTVGELARMIQGEKMLTGLEKLDLRVIRMDGWQREMRWMSTGLPWVPTSPNIPYSETPLLYAGNGLFEDTEMNEGRGTDQPFALLGAKHTDPDRVLASVEKASLPGVKFYKVCYVPRSLAGKSSRPKYRDCEVEGLRVVITDARAFKPLETAVHLLCAFYNAAPMEMKGKFFRDHSFASLAGTDMMETMIRRGDSPEKIIMAWQEEVGQFMEKRKKYLLY